MKKSQGFTLVEIAIVLVIIGLLLGGVLKGQELIFNARAKAIVNDLKGVQAAIFAYQDKFHAVPGDDPRPVADVNGTLSTANVAGDTRGNSRISGAWNSAVATQESFLMWQHLRLANVLAGNPDTAATDYLPVNSQGGRIGVSSVTPIAGMRGSFFACSDGVDGRLARQIDTYVDGESVSDRGSLQVRAVAGGAAVAPVVGTPGPADGTTYIVCMSF